MKKYELFGVVSYNADYWSDPDIRISLYKELEAKNKKDAIKLVIKTINRCHKEYKNCEGYEIKVELREYKIIPLYSHLKEK